MEAETSDITLFFGRFHPLILHIPIGFLTLAFILEVLSRFERFRQFKFTVGFALLLGGLFAILTSVLGLMLAQSGGYHEGILSVHQWTGIAVAAISLLAFFLQWQHKRRPSPIKDKVYLTLMGSMMVLLSVAGHYGGSLTHGSDYLSQYMPEGLRKLAGMAPAQKKEFKKITNLKEAVVYADIIDPIFSTYCTSCHNDSKRKGDLMMHTAEDLLKGGESGPAFVAGDAAGSDLIKRIQLPEGHEDHMPPEGKRQMSDDEVELLIWWVNQGASFEKKVADVAVDDRVQEILNGLVDSTANQSEVEIMLSRNITPASDELVAGLQGKGVKVTPLSDKVSWLQADINPGVSGDSIVDALVKVSEQLTWLSLGGTSTTDKALISIGKFKNLTRLHLGNTAVTNSGLKHLKDLAYLESLNLYATQVTDEGLQYLEGLKNLRTLYLWQTSVTPAGVENLKAALPDLQVNVGMEVTANK